MAILSSPLSRKDAVKSARARTSLLGEALAHPRASFFLVLVPTVLLLALGMMMVLSASSVLGSVRFGDAYYFVKRQVFFLAVGGAAAFVLSRCNVRALKVLGWGLVIAALTLQILTFTPLGWGEAKGNRNWVQFGTSFFRIQPSELAKLAIIVWGADLLARKQKLLDQPKHLLVPFVPVSLLLISLVVLQHDLGTGMIMGAIVVAMLWYVGASWKMLASIGAIVGAGVVVLVATSANRLGRITGFFDSTHDQMGVNLQPLRGVFALASGGWWGLGLGASRQKWGSLAEAHTDYVLAIVGEELGLVGTLVVLSLFLVLAYAGFRIALRSDITFCRYLAAGVTSWLMIQALVNIMVVLKMIPVLGVTLPLLSYGGSGLMANLAAIGMLLACAKLEPDARRLAERKKRTTGAPVTVVESRRA
ncbi:MAG: putative lipid II flippase FtsW [Micropruina glycogenica]|uniref:Probable peptidoglycan glycosyltransferase FtsW n=1 Tax=Micropruina glycogenica TaxID=75385 RepID=A0A2N9JG94_9ACTN|nr:putative lipid II flippase FtsW [Micropruina glycogenica]MCB0890625.1 putative lipid II flippase FtsW [Propionibacteriaceae bacterium]SPD87130.1 Cell division protein FtsW [Micropruina glycogenica]